MKPTIICINLFEALYFFAFRSRFYKYSAKFMRSFDFENLAFHQLDFTYFGSNGVINKCQMVDGTHNWGQYDQVNETHIYNNTK